MTQSPHRHPDAHVIDAWADELAKKLSRPKTEIIEFGFVDPAGREVTLLYEDGSQAVYKRALAVTSEARKQLAVFTEHCGYMQFALLPNMEVIEKDRIEGLWAVISHYVAPHCL